MRRNEAILLYALLKGYKVNVGKIIKNSIMSYSRSKCKGLNPHLAIITKLYLIGGVIGDWDVEETCPQGLPSDINWSNERPKKQRKKIKKEK